MPHSRYKKERCTHLSFLQFIPPSGFAGIPLRSALRASEGSSVLLVLPVARNGLIIRQMIHRHPHQNRGGAI